MPKQTQYYRLGYFADGEFLDSTTESRRFETIDSQIFGLYSIIGNGILNGWTLTTAADAVPSVVISQGQGVIGYTYTETTKSETLTPLVKNSINYIYAGLTDNSWWDQSVVFLSYLTKVNRPLAIYLGAVTVSETEITEINTDERNSIGLVSSIQEVIANHRHTGGEGQPDPVDLGSEVQGQIRQQNLPELDASLISTGEFDPLRIPELDHNTALTNKGTLTHAQLDAFVEQLSHKNASLIGETAMVNLLQLVLALKHQYPEIDDYLLNELAYIPGVSPDDIIDEDNTTAQIDKVNHTISGVAGPSFETFTKTWNSNETFSEATVQNTTIDGDLVRLLPTETKSYIEDFEEVSDWSTSIVDLSTGGSLLTTDGTTMVGGLASGALKLNIDGTTNVAFVMEKTFNSQDWTNYNRIVLHIKTLNTDHGDLYFYLRDAQVGTQDSFQLVLEAGAPTINRDTLMQGWREISLDISSFQRDSIVSVGFYMSSETGWEPSRPFELNIDEMYLTTGNMFVNTGSAKFTYGNGIPLDFSRITWEGLNEQGLKVRHRFGMSTSEFDELSPNQATWSSYQLAGYDIVPGVNPLYPYVQIEVFFTSQNAGATSPELHRLHLDYKSSSSEATFSYDSKDEWDTGTNVNIDTWSAPGSIVIANTSEIGNVTYAQTGKFVKTNPQFENTLEIAGSALPRTTNQVINEEATSFGQLSGVVPGENGTFWLADTDNNRVVEINSAGGLIRGFYGSFIEGVSDPYGLEERGPGSNQSETEAYAYDGEADEELLPSEGRVEALHSIYNPSTGLLSVIFNKNIEDTYTADGSEPRINANRMYLGAMAHRVYFNEGTELSLLGIDAQKKELWKNRENEFKNQFTFSSHVLNIQLSQADMATLASIVDFATPSITLSSPKYNQQITSSQATFEFSISNFQLGGSENNRIKWRLDYDGTYQYSLSNSIVVSNISNGLHTIEANLVDGNGNLLQNEESGLLSQFIINTGLPLLDPILSIISPTPSQILPTSPISISFSVTNHPVLPSGSHIRYQVDGGEIVEHRDLNPIQISSLADGEHNVDLWLADEDGNVVVSEYSEATIKFFIGVNSIVGLRFYMDKDAVRAEDGSEETRCNSHYVDVDSANIYLCNVKAPIDVQFIPSEISSVNPSGMPSILLAKLRTPTWTYYLGDSPSNTDPLSIYGSTYLDGHSVIQMSMTGELLFSNNAAKFASSVNEIKQVLGSAEKISENELLIADADRNRAIITLTNLTTGNTFIAWQYDSDRTVTDFHLIDNKESIISIENTGVDVEKTNVKIGTTTTWVNNTLVPLQILSGKTTQEQFLSDPDLTLYGDEFLSGTLNPGERYSYRFDNLGSFDWFSFNGSTINTGVVQVSQGRVSSTDEYLAVENDPSVSMFGSRVIKIDSWGNVIWSFGEDWLNHPKDARSAPDGSIIIST